MNRRAPTEIPCQRLPSCILGNGHDGRCVVVGCATTETPDFLIMDSRAIECGVSGNTNDLDPDSRCVDHAALDPLESDESEQLLAWVRARMAESPATSKMGKCWAVLRALPADLAMSESQAWELCKAAGWRS